MDNSKKIIVIDGTSNTGKTTLCHSISRLDDYRIIPEAIRYLERRVGLPQDCIVSPSNSLEEEINNQELFFDLEFEKIYDANIWLNRGKNVVIDKAAASIVSTAYAFEKIKKINGAFENAMYLFYKYKKKIAQYKLVEPHFSFLLYVNDMQFAKRNTKRNHILDDVWVNKEIVASQFELLKKIYSFTDAPVFFCDTSDKSPGEVFNLFLSIKEKYEARE